MTITVDASSITDVKVEGADETPEVGGAALDTLAESIKTAGSAEIDGVAGATITSDAVKTAAADALLSAGLIGFPGKNSGERPLSGVF